HGKRVLSAIRVVIHSPPSHEFDSIRIARRGKFMAETNFNPEGSAPDISQGRKIRYAVVGAGYISQVAVLPAFQHAQENSELVALVSGDAQKSKKLAKKYKIARTYSYEQYADCLGSGEVDAVYIGLPNNMHRAYTEGAADAGVHVLCENPMAITEEECESMI